MTFICSLDGHLSWQPAAGEQPASVGRICPWGGFTIAEISNEVPEGERDEYARKFAAVEDLYSALETMTRWVYEGGHNGKNEMIGDICDMGDAALAKARGEQTGEDQS